jgi:hypothetical protein
MIAKVGLLNPRTYDPTDKEEAYRLGIAAWARSKSLSLEGANKLTDVANHLRLSSFGIASVGHGRSAG